MSELTINLDRHRVPLSGTQRASRRGPYPYWGANGPIDSIDSYIFEGPHILIAEDGNTVVRPNGRGTVHWADGQFWVNNHAHVLAAAPGIDLRWLYFVLTCVEIRPYITGSAQPKLSQRNLNAVLLPTPVEKEQQRIAATLGTLDDKIASNRRLAELLEETAATVFRARFIDFVGLGEFEESELGNIPYGWRAGVVADIASLHRQFVRGESALPYIGLDLMPRGSTVLTDWATDDAPTGQAATFVEGDLLFGKLRPYFRKVGVAPINGRCSTEILVLRPRDPDLYGVLLGHVASQAFIDHCAAVSRGTKMPRAEWNDAGAFRIAIPSAAAARESSEFTRSIYMQIQGLTHESRTLREIRDALLPRLISGEIRVPDTHDPDEVIGPAAEALTAATP